MIGFFAVPWADALPPRLAASTAAAVAAMTPATTTTILDRLIELPSAIARRCVHSLTVLYEYEASLAFMSR
jgi:hypothetical protein